MAGTPKVKRSGGPQTEEGKSAVAQNAVKTGAYSNLVVLPNEDQEAFNALLDQFNHDFHPADIIETSLVRDMAVIAWKKFRLEKLENDYFIKQTNAPVTLEDMQSCGLKFNKDRFDFWVSWQMLKDEDVEFYQQVVALLKPICWMGVTEGQLSEIKTAHPFIHRALVDTYRSYDPLAGSDVSDFDLIDRLIKPANQPQQFLTSYVFNQIIIAHEAGLWVYRKRDEVAQAVSQIKQERILKIMQSDSTRRANDDLSRSFTRALGEFRKHNQWRMQNRVVDVEEDQE